MAFIPGNSDSPYLANLFCVSDTDITEADIILETDKPEIREMKVQNIKKKYNLRINRLQTIRAGIADQPWFQMLLEGIERRMTIVSCHDIWKALESKEIDDKAIYNLRVEHEGGTLFLNTIANLQNLIDKLKKEMTALMTEIVKGDIEAQDLINKLHG